MWLHFAVWWIRRADAASPQSAVSYAGEAELSGPVLPISVICEICGL
jgi:hypothetical protein